FEQVETGSVETIENMLEDDSIPQKGEFVILIEGIDESSQTEQWWKEMDLKEHVDSDRKSTRLNSSHVSISYAVFCLKKKIKRDYNKEGTIVNINTGNGQEVLARKTKRQNCRHDPKTHHVHGLRI